MEEIVGRLRCMSSGEGKRRRSLSIKHFKQRQPLRRRRFPILKTFKVEEILVVEVVEDKKRI